MKRNRSFYWGVTAICLSCSVSSAGTLYVTVSGSGTQDCSSWTDSCTLATVLDPIDPNRAVAGDEVWVESGTYYGPVALVNGVKIIGGFAGSETAASQSNPVANQTIIDGGGTGIAVTSTDDAASTMLRGFRITNGYDNSSLTANTGGGGASLLNSSAMFVQCVFDGNSSTALGGAVYVKGTGSPEFMNCKFDGNGAVDFGSGTITPYAGGAVYVHSGSPRFTNCLFTDNTGKEAGGIAVDTGAPKLINCTISQNQSTIGYGGGMYDPLGLTTVKNCIFWNDTAIRGNEETENYPGRFTKATKSDIEGGFPGTGNMDSDPLFEATGYALQSSSPCKNAGQTMSLPPDVADLDWDGNMTENVPLDLAGNNRKVQIWVDMGAYEVQP